MERLRSAPVILFSLILTFASFACLPGGSPVCSPNDTTCLMAENNIPVTEPMELGDEIYVKYGGYTESLFGLTVAGVGDVNKDGYADYLVGGYKSSPLAPNVVDDVDLNAEAGSAYLYSGKTDSLIFRKDGGAGGDHMGSAVSSLGDVNGDGYVDFIIGAMHEDNNTGAAYVLLGPDGGTEYCKIVGANEEDWFGASAAGIGDVDDDGIPDFAIGAKAATNTVPDPDLDNAGAVYIYSGAAGCPHLVDRSPIMGTGESDYFGSALAWLGDIDGDDVDDFIIGSPRMDAGGNEDAGGISVRSGADGTELYAKTGAAEYDEMGAAVAGVLDIDLDGTYDFMVGVPFSNTAGQDAGHVTIYSGADGSVLVTKYGASPGDWFGYSLAGITDLNLDGFVDYLIGAPGTSYGGSVYMYSGRDGSTLKRVDSFISGGLFGTAMASTGDVNGDNSYDIVVGAMATSTSSVVGAGSAHIVSGGGGTQ